MLVKGWRGENTHPGSHNFYPNYISLYEAKVSDVSVQDMLFCLPFLTPDALCETTFQKLELVLAWATLHFVGWVDLPACFVGFRCTQPNLHFAGAIVNCETQQRPISEPSPKSFFFDQNLRFFGLRLCRHLTPILWVTKWPSVSVALQGPLLL